MPLQENYGHDDCKDCHSLELALPAVSQVRVTISRNELVKPWKELQILVSLKTSQSFPRLSLWVVSVQRHTKSSGVQMRCTLCDGSYWLWRLAPTVPSAVMMKGVLLRMACVLRGAPEECLLLFRVLLYLRGWDLGNGWWDVITWHCKMQMVAVKSSLAEAVLQEADTACTVCWYSWVCCQGVHCGSGGCKKLSPS